MRFEPIKLPRIDRRGVIHAEATCLWVPETRGREDGRALALRVIRLPGRKEGTPLFFSDGGPGDDTVGNLSRYPDRFAALAAAGDVYFLDQRGSHWTPAPNLDWCSARLLDDGELVSPATRAEAWRTTVDRALTALAQVGCAPEGYTGPAIAGDYVALADRLGLERFSFYGFSFGTQVGQLLLRDHAERLQRVLLWGLEPLDATLKLPAFLRAQLTRGQRSLQGNRLLRPFSRDVYERAGRLRERLDQTPILVTLRRAGEPERRLWFGGVLVDAVMSLAMSREGLVQLPFWLLLLERAPRVAAPAIVRRFGLDRVSIVNLQEFLVDASLGASSERWRRVLETTPTRCPMRGFCQESLLALRSRLSRFDLGPTVRLPAVGDTPVYICNGDLDANTPLENLSSVVRRLPNAHVLKINNLDHRHVCRSRPRRFQAVERDLVRFLRGEEPLLRELSLPLRLGK